MVPANSGYWQKGKLANPATVVDVWIALPIENVEAAIKALIAISDPASHLYGQFWTSESVLKTFRPTAVAGHAVLQWLEQNRVQLNEIRHFQRGSFMQFNASVSLSTAWDGPLQSKLTLLRRRSGRWRGWDAVTGLGRPDFERLRGVLWRLP